MKNGEVDHEELTKMVDTFMERGFNYFDTAHGYVRENSEIALRRCPKGIHIPDLFSLLNAKRAFQNWNTDYYYNNIHTDEGIRASDCQKCGKCERICPQHLPIRELLVSVSEEFDRS